MFVDCDQMASVNLEGESPPTVVAKPGAVRWAVNFEKMVFTQDQWEQCLSLVAPEEKDRIGR